MPTMNVKQQKQLQPDSYTKTWVNKPDGVNESQDYDTSESYERFMFDTKRLTRIESRQQ